MGSTSFKIIKDTFAFSSTEYPCIPLLWLFRGTCLPASTPKDNGNINS